MIPSTAVAASLTFVIVSLALRPSGDRELAVTESQDKHVHDRDSLAVDFQQVMELALSSPNQAISSLVEKYAGVQKNANESTRLIGYRPLLFDAIPIGFERVSTHVRNMPCCKCTASICVRKGS